jgi:NADPH:quinone reductase-like Zn-dependent oxidoreductase
MKAIVYTQFGPPEVLQLKEVKTPEPKDQEVLIRIYATTVVKEDPDMRASPGFNGLLKPRNLILGQELAGEIEAVGSAVTRFRPGDQVLGIDSFGAYAEYKCMSEDKALVLKPANMTYEEAAAVPNGALTALPFLRDKGKIRSGQQVLIYGASGSVGTAALQLARIFGADVTGVCSTGNVEMVKSLGAEQVIDYTKVDFTQNGKSYDIIFDTVGKVGFSRCKNSLKPTGAYLTTIPTLRILPDVLGLARHSSKKARFMATGLRSANAKIKDLVYIKELVEAGQFKSVIDRCYPLEQVAEAHRYVGTGHKKGNVVIMLLVSNVPDYNGSQIQVARIKVEE